MFTVSGTAGLPGEWRIADNATLGISLLDTTLLRHEAVDKKSELLRLGFQRTGRDQLAAVSQICVSSRGTIADQFGTDSSGKPVRSVLGSARIQWRMQQ